MATQEFVFNPGQILVPEAGGRLEPVGFGPSLTITRGQAMGQKTSDARCYPLNPNASDGTQVFKGFSQYSLTTDSSSNVDLTFGGTGAGTNFFTPPSGYCALYCSGIFNPNNLTTAVTGAAVAEVDTITAAGTITVGDLYTIILPNGVQVDYEAQATPTATTVANGLRAAWNANPISAALATASGTATMILTAKTAGDALGLAVSVNGIGTIALVITTAAVAGAQSEVDTWTLTTAPSTGDTFTLTWSQPNGVSSTAVATVGSTATVAAATVLIAAAWNAVPALAALATATSTSTTVVLTGVTVGNSFSIAMTTSSSSTTLAKVVTTPAAGRNISDILSGAPGSRILPSGFWEVP